MIEAGGKNNIVSQGILLLIYKKGNPKVCGNYKVIPIQRFIILLTKYTKTQIGD